MGDLLDRAYDMLQDILSKQEPRKGDDFEANPILMTMELESRIRQLLEDINDDIYSRL